MNETELSNDIRDLRVDDGGSKEALVTCNDRRSPDATGPEFPAIPKEVQTSEH
jgi:hypothetical protein